MPSRIADAVFRVNLLKSFLYPLSSLKKLLAACLILPLSLAVLVPPILLGMGVLTTVSMSLKQGLGFTLVVAAVCVVVGALPFTLLAGYLLRCRQEVIAGNSRLPVWDRFSLLMADGGRMDTLALLVAVPTAAFFWAGVTTLGFSWKNLYDHHTWGAAGLALLGSGAGLVFLLCAFVVWLTIMAFSPIASLRLALGDSPGTAISPRGMFRDIKRGWFDYLLCSVVVWAISVGFGMAQSAFWPLIVVSYPVQVYLQLVWANLLGQYARAYLLGESSERLT